MPARTPQIEKMAQAIARVENTSSYSSFLRGRNNPGALMYAGQAGATPFQTTMGTFAQFGTETQGWEALYRQIELNAAKGLTFYTFFAGERDGAGNVIPGGYYGYAPAGHGSNQPNVYANTVSSLLGVPVTMRVLDYINGLGPSTSTPAPSPVPSPSSIDPETGVDEMPRIVYGDDPQATDTGTGTNTGSGNGDEGLDLSQLTGLPMWALIGAAAAITLALAFGRNRG